MYRTRRAGTAFCILVTLLIPAISAMGDGERRVVFEDVGEYTDGGMAVA
jgi:hypothetical protein